MAPSLHTFLFIFLSHFSLASPRCVGPCGAVTCLTPQGTSAPCGPDAQQCGPLFGPESVNFHVRDRSCGNNDANSPFYDPRFGIYHLFYQAQLGIFNTSLEKENFTSTGPVIGHAVSADLIHWAHLPIALWNDAPFRNLAVFTGSATVLPDGSPHLVYPGICGWSGWPSCGTYFHSTPSDPSDPLLTVWADRGVLANSTMDDPTSAWHSPATGEWRFASARGTVFFTNASDGEFEGPWYETPTQVFSPPTFTPSNGGISCGDFFPLPTPCTTGPGCGGGGGGGGTPPFSHVYKLLIESAGGHWGDLYWLGNYSEGGPGSGGVFHPTNFSLAQPLDAAYPTHVSASKSFFDPVRGERVMWGTIFGAGKGALTLPRDLHWNGGVGLITALPVPAYTTLRAEPPLYAAASLALAPGETLWLGDWEGGVGNSSEVQVTFALPPPPTGSSQAPLAVFGLSVLHGLDPASGTNASIPITFTIDTATHTGNVTLGGARESFLMPGTDLPGGDYSVVTNVSSDPLACQALCRGDAGCAAFTHVLRDTPPGRQQQYDCCLKGPDFHPPTPSQTCISGIKHPSPTPMGGQVIPLPLLPQDTLALDVRVLVDRVFMEVFLLQGRVAASPVLPGWPSGAVTGGAAGMTLFNLGGEASPGTTITAASVAVWHMGSCFVEPAVVVEQARVAMAASRKEVWGGKVQGGE